MNTIGHTELLVVFTLSMCAINKYWIFDRRINTYDAEHTACNNLTFNHGQLIIWQTLEAECWRNNYKAMWM